MGNIRVIKDNYNTQDPEQQRFEVFCHECRSELEISKEDTHIGWLGARFVTCPCCGNESMVEELDGITLTKDNLQFPNHFLKTQGLEIDNSKIITEIQRMIKGLRRSKEPYCSIEFDNVCIIVFRHEDDEDYHIIVTQDYYETSIPFESNYCGELLD